MKRLIEEARKASERAYCPYSHFLVGAAIKTDKGIFSGCNVENASYGLTICAERNAISSAIAAGAREIKSLVIYTPTEKATAPCGACRQVIREFAPLDITVLCVSKGEKVEMSLDELLPFSFGPENLG